MTSQERENVKKEIIKNVNHIKDILDIEIADDDYLSIRDKGDKLSSLAGSSAHWESLALGVKVSAIKDSILIHKDDGLSATQLKQLAEGDAWEEIALHEYASRISRAITHVLDWCRTRMSTYKSELENNLTKQP